MFDTVVNYWSMSKRGGKGLFWISNLITRESKATINSHWPFALPQYSLKDQGASIQLY
jgi:hypothetical protein